MKMNSAVPFWAYRPGDQGYGIRDVFQTQKLGFGGFGDDKVLFEPCDIKNTEISLS